MNICRGIIVSTLLVALTLLALACGQTEQDDTGEDHTGYTGRSAIGPGPVASTSEAIMTLEEIQDRTGDYMALKLWIGVAHRTAENDPGNFHQTLFSEPDRRCVEQYWKLLEETPDLTAETLTICGENSAARGRGWNWNSAGQAEREDRARRSAGLLFWSMDPPSLMSVTIAHRRGRDVSVRTNPVFARFAAEYNGCEEATGEYAMELAGAETSEQLAETWLRVEQEMQMCSDTVTASLFDGR